MGERKGKINRKARFLDAHKYCCFCGGEVPTTTWDHVPPRACFPRGFHPEEYEFPACFACNQATRNFDHVFGFYATILDHDQDNYSYETSQRLLQGIANNIPEALPKLDLSPGTKRKSLRQMGAGKPEGVFYSDLPLVGVPLIFGDAATVLARKIACALYYKEVGKIMRCGQQLIGGWHQLQNPLSKTLTEYFNEHMSAYRQPTRSTIKNYGNTFVYKFAYNEEEDFFGYAAQFGLGLFLWCLAARPEMDMSDSIVKIWRVGDAWVA